MIENIEYKDFEKVDIRVGKIIKAYDNDKLKKPSIIMEIDFGPEIGIKKSSAQLQKNYQSSNLINKQVAAVVNFPKKQIGNIISEVVSVVSSTTENMFNTFLIEESNIFLKKEEKKLRLTAVHRGLKIKFIRVACY